MSSSYQERDPRIDVARLIGFSAVVLIHVGTVPSEPSLAGLLDHMARFAVPMFFMISGYLFEQGVEALPMRWWRAVRRLSAIFLAWAVVYTLAGELRPDTGHSTSSGPLYELARTAWTGGDGFHLWFLPSLLQALTLFALLRRRGWGAITTVAGLLLAFGLAAGPYAGATGAAPVIQGLGWPDGLTNTRNGPFFAFPCFVLGALAKQMRWTLPPDRACLLAATGLFVCLAEAWMLAAGTRFGPHDYLIGTLLFGMGTFLLLKGTGTPCGSITARLGRYGAGMYCIHVLFVWWLPRPWPDPSLLSDIVQVALVCIASASTVLVLSRLPGVGRFVQ